MGKAAPIAGALGTILPAVGGLFGGGGNGPTQTTQTQLSPGAQSVQDQLIQQGRGVASQPFNQFQGPRTQQFGQGFNQAAGNLSQVDPRIMQALSGGAGGLGIGSGFFGDFLGQGGPGGPEFNQANIDRFTNPNQQANIDATRAGFARAGESALNTVGDQFTRQGAFGGTRQGIAEGELAGNLARQEEEAVSGIRTRGFDDAAQRLAMEQGRFGQFQGQQLGAAGQLGNLGFGSTQALQNALQQAGQSGLGVGQLRQQLGQFGIGQDMNKFNEPRNFDMQNIGLLQSILGGLPNQGMQTQNMQPGGTDPFQAAGGIGSILGSLFGGGQQQVSNQQIQSQFGGSANNPFGITPNVVPGQPQQPPALR